jgi:uncharacterized RDD family membrane protein YckC
LTERITVTNQSWNDPANPQGQQPTYGTQPSAPETTPGYQAPDATYGQSYGSPAPSYGQQASYGTTPAYGSPDASQPSAPTYGSAPSYGTTSSYGAAPDASQASASSYGTTPAYGSTSSYGTTPDASQPSASSYGSAPSYGTDPAQGAASYGSPSAAAGSYGSAPSYGTDPAQGAASYGSPSAATGSYGQQSYGTPVSGQSGSYGAPVQSGYGDPSSQQVGGYDPYGSQQAGAVSPYGYDSGYATPAPALADFGKRALAGLIDYVAPGLVIGLVGGILSSVALAIDNSGTLSGIVSLLLYAATFGFLIWNTILKGGKTGVTLGRQVAKIKLVSEATGQPIGAMNAFIRHICHFIDSIICYVGWLFPLWDAKRQTIADKIMKTVVITNDGTPTQGQQF